MFKIKELLGLSEEGHRDFKRAVRSCVLSNFSLLRLLLSLFRQL
jgi:hypothetical protein